MPTYAIPKCHGIAGHAAARQRLVWNGWMSDAMVGRRKIERKVRPTNRPTASEQGRRVAGPNAFALFADRELAWTEGAAMRRRPVQGITTGTWDHPWRKPRARQLMIDTVVYLALGTYSRA